MRKTKSTTNVIEIIEHIESQLSTLKQALKEIKPTTNGAKEGARSVREYEFCGMWKDREDMRGLSSTEWLAKLRSDQWGRI